MFRPRKMKFVEITVLKNDANAVLEYLGRRRAIHFSDSGTATDGQALSHIGERLESIGESAQYLGLELPAEAGENSSIPDGADDALTRRLYEDAMRLKNREVELNRERHHIAEALKEARAFSGLNAPFADLDQLSYLTLRVGHLDPQKQEALRENLGDRAVIVPLGGGSAEGRILAATSRKGRFALDSELKKSAFEPIVIPKGYQGIPSEMIKGMEDQKKRLDGDLARLTGEKEKMAREQGGELVRLASSWLVAQAVERIKARFSATESIYLLSGWMPRDMVKPLVRDLAKLSGGRTAIRSYNPNEIPAVRDGSEQVPVSLKHGKFVRGFEGVVFSYGAPLYGTIDPTPLVAFFFTLLFGLMFGDMGQGFVLFLLGLLTGKKGPLRSFNKYSVPLVAVGIAAMIMGFLTGEVFTMENLLVAPTRAISAAITGQPHDHILHILPLAEKGGSVKKLFYFFGFTVAIGVIVNSLGLIINIVNRCILKKYQTMLFSKTGLAGLVFFWYAIFIVIRLATGGSLTVFDSAGIGLPLFCIVFGPLLWRVIAGERPLFKEGLMVFVMESFVEIMETFSSYMSNTMSFLRVGAFALSHAVLSYIVFLFSEKLAQGAFGPVSSLFLMVAGNAIIIVLEGIIVAIQVIRLQYYEFFSKFFAENGVEFAPFRFGGKM